MKGSFFFIKDSIEDFEIAAYSEVFFFISSIDSKSYN